MPWGRSGGAASTVNATYSRRRTPDRSLWPRTTTAPGGVPAISAGVYGYPLAQAAAVAIEAVTAALDAHPQVGEARFWLFDERANDAFADALGALG